MGAIFSEVDAGGDASSLLRAQWNGASDCESGKRGCECGQMNRFRTKDGLSESSVLYIKSCRHVCFRVTSRGSSWSNMEWV